MKKNFFTGLVILLPIAFTLLVVTFVINFLTKPFIITVYNTLDYYDTFTMPFLLISRSTLLLLTSKLLIMLGLIALTLLLGIFGRFLLIKYLFRTGDYLIQRIPLVNKVHKAAKDVIHTLFSSNGKTFSKVVLVPFPHPKAFSIGLITNEELSNESDAEFSQLVSVFVPGTPNPSMGFMLLFKREQLIAVDMKVEEALKFLVSCGIVCSGFMPKAQSDRPFS